MARKVKCPSCSKMNEKEDTMKYNNRYYCKQCYEELKAEKDSNKEDWNLLFEYICKLYNIKKPTGLMFKQLGDYRKEPYNFTNGGMYATLVYYYDTLGNTVLEGTGLGIIPYYYDKAKKHYIEMQEVEDSLDNYSEPINKKIEVDLTKRNKLTKLDTKSLSYDDIDWSEDIE